MGSLATAPILPTLDAVGRDLLAIPRWRKAVSLSAPFILVASYFVAASMDWWLLAMFVVANLSFITYGSLSHDLVHRTLGLRRGLNDALLSTIELLMLRSGRAYRLAHLNHHARYPDAADDPEGAAAHGSLASALAAGFLFFPRLWCWAYRRYPAHRPRLALEAVAIIGLIACSIALALLGLTLAPIAYVVLSYCGTWIVPLATAYIPHLPKGETELLQTCRFRGWAARLIAFEHLYHLEHHLYPAVPHHNWHELARRLDPILDSVGVPIVRLVPKRQQRCRVKRSLPG